MRFKVIKHFDRLAQQMLHFLQKQTVKEFKTSVGDNMKLWESSGVQMRLPEGCKFIDETHFSGLFVHHAPSKTIHVDDTVNYFNEMGTIMQWIGGKPRRFSFHPKLKQSITTPDGPIQFKNWFEKMLNDWDFDNICLAHHGHVIGGAKDGLRALIEKQTQFLQQLAEDK